MAITDMLNRRVRARPDDEDDVYSEQSDAGEEPSQEEAEEENDSDAEDLQSDDVRAFLRRQKAHLLTKSFHFSRKPRDQKTKAQTQAPTRIATTMPPMPSQKKNPTPTTTSKPP